VRRGSLEAPLRDALRRQWVPAQLWRLLVLDHWLEKNRARTLEDLEPAFAALVATADSRTAGLLVPHGASST